MRTNDTFEVIRSEDPFTRINNGIFKDKRLKLKTLGLLCLCLSLPEDWRFSIRGLTAICADGQAAVVSALDELEQLGYLRRDKTQEHQASGKFGGVRYVFFDVPTTPCVDFPYTVHPYTDKPYTENPPQEIIKQETKKQEIPPKPPRGRTAKKAPDHLPEEFDRLWKAYPRGDDKQGAIREWDRLKPDEATVFAMKSALLLQMQSDEWQRGIGIPYFCRWLSHRRWEDEKLRSRPAPACTVEAPPEVAAW
jgi:hypothetical protein